MIKNCALTTTNSFTNFSVKIIFSVLNKKLCINGFSSINFNELRDHSEKEKTLKLKIKSLSLNAKRL